MTPVRAGESVPGAPAYEVYGRYVNAPVWPWVAAGWGMSGMFALFFIVSWSVS
jgi:hypothetical protein